MRYKFKSLKEERNAEINTNDIRGVTLLSIEEVENFPEEVRAYSDWWWLRSPGGSSRQVVFVDRDGHINDNGCGVLWSLALRPALILNRVSSNFKNGDIVEVFNRKWYYKDGLALLMDKPLTQMAFRRSKKRKANDYKESDVKKYLNNWFKNALNGNYDYAITANNSSFSDGEDGESDYEEERDKPWYTPKGIERYLRKHSECEPGELSDDDFRRAAKEIYQVVRREDMESGEWCRSYADMDIEGLFDSSTDWLYYFGDVWNGFGAEDNFWKL